MKKFDPKSWRMWLLLCILCGIVIVPLATPIDDLIFACRIRCGSGDAKQQCGSWKESLADGSPLPHPWWTFSSLLGDTDPYVRIIAAKLRYSLAPNDPRVLDILIAETENPDAYIRGVSVWEFWNMHDQTEQTLPVLERVLFEDTDEGARRSAFRCLQPLSKGNRQARALIDRAAARHPIQSTRKFARSALEAWDKNESSKGIHRAQ
jgi:hypothetical protein